MSTLLVDLGLPRLPAFYTKARETAASTLAGAREMSATTEDWLAEMDALLSPLEPSAN